MKRKLIFLINPISGRGDKNSLDQVIRNKTSSAGFEFEIYPTVASGNYAFLKSIIREKGFTDVIIAGGDGTINQVIGALHDMNLVFGIIPCGSGNGLAFSAGISKNREQALEVIYKGKPESTDAFLINDRFACMLCGLGLDAQVAHDFANDPKRGLITYVRKTLKNFLIAPTYPFEIHSGKQKMKMDALFISIANSNQFGNNFTIAPEASLRDGVLDIVVMNRQSKLSMVLQAVRQVGGYNKVKLMEEISEKANVIYFQSDKISIKNPSLAPLHIDGDPAESSTEISIRILKNCFRLIYP